MEEEERKGQRERQGKEEEGGSRLSETLGRGRAALRWPKDQSAMLPLLPSPRLRDKLPVGVPVSPLVTQKLCPLLDSAARDILRGQAPENRGFVSVQRCRTRGYETVCMAPPSHASSGAA